jgi:hypothetical protein
MCMYLHIKKFAIFVSLITKVFLWKKELENFENIKAGNYATYNPILLYVRKYLVWHVRKYSWYGTYV